MKGGMPSSVLPSSSASRKGSNRLFRICSLGLLGAIFCSIELDVMRAVSPVLQHLLNDKKNDNMISLPRESNNTLSSSSSSSSLIRHTPMVLDLLPWEYQSMHEFRNQSPVCQPPDGIPTTCCLGSLGTPKGMMRTTTDSCFLKGPGPFQKVEEAARRSLEETASLLLRDDNNNPHHYYDCDICRIMEILYHHNLTFLATGDSMMLQTFSGFGCELARRGYHVIDHSNFPTTFKGTEGVRATSTLDVSGPEHWNNHTIRLTFLKQYKPRSDMVEMSKLANNYDVVMMNFGLHWNWGTRKTYEAFMNALFHAMKHSNIQLLAYRETSAQHFDATAGEWVRTCGDSCVPIDTKNRSDFLDRYRFRWREYTIHNAAISAGYKVVVATDVLPERNNTNRGNDELVILPFLTFTSQFHDLHPDECTHYCSTPFFWMPLWRSLRLAMDRRWSSTVATVS